MRVQEFYFLSGAMLHSSKAQRDYASINYTQVARDLADSGELHAIVQLVARRGEGENARYSLSCNPDVTLDVLDAIAAAGGRRPLLIGVVHPELPFLGGDAEVDARLFDTLIDDGVPAQPLFALPRDAVDPVEHAIGMHASALVRDGGTLQIGIGALSDAIVAALLLRQQSNGDYLAALRALRGDDPANDPLIARYGGLGTFARGLYGASEMVMDGFMHLRRHGVLRRNVYDDLDLQRALDAGTRVDDGTMRGGHYLKGAFFLGSKELYAWLRDLSGADYDGLVMSRVSDVNQLYGGREAARCDAAPRRALLQHLHDGDACSAPRCRTRSRTAASSAASAASTTSSRWRTRSRADARHCCCAQRATRGSRVESNIRFNYGHTTIPRHLRDIYITEYGIADLRGTVRRGLHPARCSRSAMRVSRTSLPSARNAPASSRAISACRMRGGAIRRPISPNACGRSGRRVFFSSFRSAAISRAVEQRLLPALLWLKKSTADWRRWPSVLGALIAPGSSSDMDAPLERLGLSTPGSLGERLLARLVRGALSRTAA